MESVAALMKVGRKEHLEAFRSGDVYCNTIEYFKQMEDPIIGMADRFECSERVEKFSELSIKMDGKYVPVLKNGFVTWDGGRYRGNLFCTYFICIPVDEIDKKEKYPLNIKTSLGGFADSFVIIFNIGEFIKRFNLAVNSTGAELYHGRVEYLDYKKYEGDITPFNKDIRFSDQNELRFYIDRVAQCKEDAISYKLGDLSDIISEVYEVESMPTLTIFPKSRI